MKENLHFYDIKIDDMRAVTQKDIDTWTSMIKSQKKQKNYLTKEHKDKLQVNAAKARTARKQKTIERNIQKLKERLANVPR